MSNPFIGEIKMWACNFAPRYWANCDGQLMRIEQNPALFSLIGTIYGGDGQTYFALPNLRGRTPLHQGRGPGLSNRRIGEPLGQETVVLQARHIPSHTHQMKAEEQRGSTGDPADNVPAELPAGINAYSTNSSLAMNSAAIDNTGSDLGHNNMMPFQTIRFCIALWGISPPRS